MSMKYSDFGHSVQSHNQTYEAPARPLFKGSSLMLEESQKTVFEKVKETLTKSPILALFDAGKETISADASSYGLGSVLM